ncbi:hypothetical protein CLCR_09294 [Cladophialophora carrionii]|uniref:Uncharacterized protein n=1 Tax=Cladophialophora carrionii TaxID=86049 RepID=A0A1C1CUH8_9EURO|nr:hypothetical protein CLCR_09294 [Cladophialophora carrionii]
MHPSNGQYVAGREQQINSQARLVWRIKAPNICVTRESCVHRFKPVRMDDTPRRSLIVDGGIGPYNSGARVCDRVDDVGARVMYRNRRRKGSATREIASAIEKGGRRVGPEQRPHAFAFV